MEGPTFIYEGDAERETDLQTSTGGVQSHVRWQHNDNCNIGVSQGFPILVKVAV